MINRIADSGAAAAIGVAIFTTTVQLREPPGSVIDTLGYLTMTWAWMLFVAAVLAFYGAVTRSKKFYSMRAQISLGAEYIGWLMITVCALVYLGAVLIRFNLSALITLGFMAALGLLTFGRWWAIHTALMAARKQGEGNDT
jgi:hypothetical protein